MRVLALCVIPLSLGAQVRSRIAEGLEAIQAAHLKADLTFLASEPLEGRLSLERGSEAAIQWIASEFAKAGLTPLNGESFLQPVPLIEYRTDRQLTGLILRRDGQEQEFHMPDAVGGFPDDVTVRANVLFAGYGITAPELHYDDYAGVDARGKIVLLFPHEPQENDAQSIFNGRGNTRWANTRAKMINAQRHGALGVLITPDPHHAAAGAARGQQRSVLRPTQALAGDHAIPVFTISEKLQDELFAAAGKNAADLRAAIDATLKPSSKDLPGVAAELRVVNSLRRRANSANVVGMLEGSDPARRNETVLFSGHFDHDGPAPNGGYYPGADDNGSGTVAVVELARAFARNRARPRRSLVFAVFAAEERGLLGSYYYVAHPLRPLDTTRAVINFDMIGRNETPTEQTKGRIDIDADTSNEMNLVGAVYSPDYRATVERANNVVGLKLNYKWDQEASLNVLFRSDQYPFLLHGVPALWWFTGFHPDYHQTTDTVDRINFAKMEKIVKLAFITGFDFAELDAPPRFQAAAK